MAIFVQLYVAKQCHKPVSIVFFLFSHPLLVLFINTTMIKTLKLHKGEDAFNRTANIDSLALSEHLHTHNASTVEHIIRGDFCP